MKAYARLKKQTIDAVALQTHRSAATVRSLRLAGDAMSSTSRLMSSATAAALALVLGNWGCGGGSGSMQLLISVSLSQTTAMVQAGATTQFTATVNNDPTGKGVTWSVICSAAACGSVSPTSTASGTATTYTAPGPPATDMKVTLTATSSTDSSKSASATITVPAIAASVMPASATVQVGGTVQFTATVTNDSANKGVTWALACSATSCGTVSPTSTPSGTSTTYSAPTIPPMGNLMVTLTATSVADPTKSASAIITVPSATVFIAPASATVEAGAMAQFTATVGNDPSNKGVTWVVSCSAAPCGTVSPTSTPSGAATTYTAPSTPPASNLAVTLTAKSVADPVAFASATVTVLSVRVAISPTSALLPGGTTQAFTAAVTNDPTSGGVTWALTVNGTACSATACGTLSSTSANPVTYSAPTTVSTATSVKLTATSVADPAKSATATINLTFGSVKIVPNSLNFGILYLSEKSTLATTVTNTASTTLGIAGITITGGDASEFSQANNCGTSVTALTSCTISVTFAPTFGGTSFANVSITDSSLDSPQQVSLSGILFPSHLIQQATPSPLVQDRTMVGPQYFLVKLGSLGGTAGRSNVVNDRGWVSGWSNLAGDNNHHAVLWVDGNPSDLGTLGGQNSEIEFTAKNNFGLLAGGTDASNIDPYGENFCAFTATDNLLCSAFQWQNGVMSPLPGLGGNNSYATGSNRLGHIVGWAETPTLDPNCLAPQRFDWLGALWKEGHVQVLPSLPGDVISAAFAINDLDEAVGGSGICGSAGVQGFTLSTHAVIWRGGSPIDLGSLGGQMNNVATGINDRGQVVGFSDVSGDTTMHAFFWQNGKMTDLGNLPGDFLSFAWGVSESGQALGQSCDANGNCRGFLWQDGVMTDLNTLIPANSPLFIIDANDMNSAGEITGQAFDPLTGEMPAIKMIPCALADDPGCRSKAQENVRIELPQNVRDALRKKRLHFRK